MVELKFNCPHCNQSLEAPEEMLGENIECPACNGAIQLPIPEPNPVLKKMQIRVVSQKPETTEEPPKWYYNIKGKRVGPVDAIQIQSLAIQGVINNSTLVWREGFSEWVAVGQTTLKLVSSGPPPLTGEAVGNGLVWTVAFVPILGTLLQHFIAMITESDSNNLWFITIILNILICIADGNVLKNAGHDTTKFGGWTWLVPVYLFKRANALCQGQGYFVTWMICFFISFFL